MTPIKVNGFINTWLPLVFCVVGLFGYGSLYAYPAMYSSEPIHATVVDSSTGKPLKGVIVVAAWTLEQDQFHGSRPLGFLELMETVTDNEGKFYFPAWGPKIVSIPFSLSIHLTEQSPFLIFYKAGYKTITYTDGWNDDHPSLRKSRWTGTQIDLDKLGSGSAKENSKVFEGLYLPGKEEDWFLAEMKCSWRKLPHLEAALSGFYDPALPMDYRLYNDYEEYPQCGSYRELVKQQYYPRIFLGIQENNFLEKLAPIDMAKISRDVLKAGENEPISISLKQSKVFGVSESGANSSPINYGESNILVTGTNKGTPSKTVVVPKANISTFYVYDTPGFYHVDFNAKDNQGKEFSRSYVITVFFEDWETSWY